MNTINKGIRYAKKAARNLKLRALAAGTAVTVAAGSAQAQVVLPDTGVDASGIIEALILAVGGVISSVILGWAAFQAAKMLMKWAKKVG